MDAELEFAIQTSTTGKQLFDQVSYSISAATTHIVFLLSVATTHIVLLLSVATTHIVLLSISDIQILVSTLKLYYSVLQLLMRANLP